MSKRRIEYVPLDELPEAEVNPKGHDDGLLDESFDRFGYMEPVLIDERTGRLVGGHGRKHRLVARHAAGQEPPDGIEVRKRDGAWLVPVVRGWASLNDDEATAALVVLNQATVAGGWQRDVLGSLLDDLRSRSVPLTGIGFNDADVDLMLSEAPNLTPDDDPDRSALLAAADITVGEPQQAVEVGQRWRLGWHVLVVADVMTGWPAWRDLLEGDALFCPYPGPFVALAPKATEVRMVLVQPETYIAGHIIDKWRSIHGDDSVELLP